MLKKLRRLFVTNLAANSRRTHLLLSGALLLCVTSLDAQFAFRPGPQQFQETPDFVVYRHLFRHVAKYQEFAESAEAKGLSSPFRHSFRTRLELNPIQEQDLNRIARDCQRQLSRLDVQAAAIRGSFRKQYPTGKLAPGVKLPPPPAEIFAILAQREAVISSSLNDLKAALGNQEFQRVNGIVKSKIAPQIVVHNIQRH